MTEPSPSDETLLTPARAGDRQALEALRCGRCRGGCDILKQTLATCRTTGASVTVPATVQASIRNAIRGFLSQNG